MAFLAVAILFEGATLFPTSPHASLKAAVEALHMASGAGCCPQARVATRNSMIHEAVQRGNLAEVADVVQKDWGAVNEPGSQLRTPLMLAARWGRVNLIEYLGSQGARLEDVDTAQRTALHWATEYGRHQAVRALLHLGANPNAKDMKGLTPVHYAVQWAQVEALKALLEHGASVWSLDVSGQRPRDLLARRHIMTPACQHIMHALALAEQGVSPSPPSAPVPPSPHPSPSPYPSSSASPSPSYSYSYSYAPSSASPSPSPSYSYASSSPSACPSSATTTPLLAPPSDSLSPSDVDHSDVDIETDEQPLDAATIQDLMMLFD